MCFVALCLAATVEFSAAEPEGARLIYEGGGVRDVAGSVAGDSLYLSSYASDEVVEIDPADGAVRRRVKVAEGPTAIVVHSSGVAVLSRAAASVSLLDPADLSFQRSVPVTPGTSTLFPAGAGRLGAMNSFAGEICLIDTQAGSVMKRVVLDGGVPVGAAFDGERIAVVGRARPTVWMLDAESLAVIATGPLPAAPRGIVSPMAGRFAIDTDAGMMLLDAATLVVSPARDILAKSVHAYPGGVLCVAEGAVLFFGVDLGAAGTVALPQGADAARSIGGALFAWSRTLGRLWRVDAALAPAVETVAPILAPLDPIVAASATLAAAESPAPAAPAPPAIDAAPAPEAESRFTVQPERLHLGGFKPYAPHFGDPTGRTFNEALARALNAGADEDSILSAEFPDRLEHLKFGRQLRSINADGRAGVTADGGVEFDLGDVHVSAESISLQSDPRELRLEGSPTLTRGASVLSAERVYAFDTPLPDIPGFWPIVPSRNARPVPHPLVPRGYKDPAPQKRPSLGTIELEDVALEETDRRLTADRLKLNTLARQANLENVRGQAGPLYFGAESLRILGPRAAAGEDFWVTTCDEPEPHYRFRVSRAESEPGDEVVVTNARLQLRRAPTPLYVPRYTVALGPGSRGLDTEIKVAGSTALGGYVNVAHWFRVNDSVQLAPRVFATARLGTGVGFDTEYNLMKDPASALFRSRGQLRTLSTTEQNGYTEWYHRQELTPDTVLLGQWEQWYERDVIKDFYPNDYENRTGPRSFLSVAHTRPDYMLTGTVAPSTHDFTRDTQKLPELTFHLFERQLGGGFYGAFGAVGGYYETQPESIGAGRATTLARLSYDWNVARGFNVLPFFELDGTYYTQTLDESGDAFRGTATVGTTVQTRVQRSYPGLGNFTGFKHIIIPSATISYRPAATLDAAENPRFDALDDRPGRVRVESTLDNILLGRNSANKKVWPVARLTFYQGYDLENEAIRANDYEIDLEVRPRPAWGVRTVAEIHDVSSSSALPGDDFNRLITYGFYDNKLGKNTLNGRVGFAYTESGPGVLNQEILYGVGYKIAKKWSAAFEQRYDFERQEFTRQTYSLLRKLHDWEIGFTLRDRQDSVDFGIQINLVDFPEIGAGM